MNRPSEEELNKTATAQPHAFSYVDRLLNLKSDGYNVQITVGWETPTGTYAPVATVAMPAPFAKQLGEALLQAEKDASNKRGSSRRS